MRDARRTLKQRIQTLAENSPVNPRPSGVIRPQLLTVETAEWRNQAADYPG